MSQSTDDTLFAQWSIQFVNHLLEMAARAGKQLVVLDFCLCKHTYSGQLNAQLQTDRAYARLFPDDEAYRIENPYSFHMYERLGHPSYNTIRITRKATSGMYGNG